MKNQFRFLGFAALMILLALAACEKEDVELYEGYIINQSNYTLTVSVVDFKDGNEVTGVKLSPNFQSKIKLEERKYSFKAYRNDGSHYNTATMFINAIRNDATTPSGEVCDWLVIFY